eukprot:COSAG01_NODE_34279_length_550_cov_1.048780_1_plen_79_part_01
MTIARRMTIHTRALSDGDELSELIANVIRATPATLTTKSSSYGSSDKGGALRSVRAPQGRATLARADVLLLLLLLLRLR